jgi:hypothetical protein
LLTVIKANGRIQITQRGRRADRDRKLDQGLHIIGWELSVASAGTKSATEAKRRLITESEWWRIEDG